MVINNNNSLRPINEEATDTSRELNLLSFRVNSIENTLVGYETEVDTETLNASNVNVSENINTKTLNVEEDITSDTITAQSIKTDRLEYTQMNLNLIDAYDFVVDSQERFDEMFELAQGSSFPYKNIAIVGGKGNGENGEYLLNNESSTTYNDFKNATITCYNNVVINLTYVKGYFVFDYATIKDLTINVDNIGNNIYILLSSYCDWYNLKVYDKGVNQVNDQNGVYFQFGSINDSIISDYAFYSSLKIHNTHILPSKIYECESDSLYPYLYWNSYMNIEEDLSYTIFKSSLKIFKPTKSMNRTDLISDGLVVYSLVGSNIDISSAPSDFYTKIISTSNEMSVEYNANTIIGNASNPKYKTFEGSLNYDNLSYDYGWDYSPYSIYVDSGEKSRSVFEYLTNAKRISPIDKNMDYYKYINGNSYLYKVSDSNAYVTDLNESSLSYISSSLTETTPNLIEINIPSDIMVKNTSLSLYILYYDNSKTLVYKTSNEYYLDALKTKRFYIYYDNNNSHKYVFKYGDYYYTNLLLNEKYTPVESGGSANMVDATSSSYMGKSYSYDFSQQTIIIPTSDIKNIKLQNIILDVSNNVE